MATATKRNKVVSRDLFLPEALAKIPSKIDLERFLSLMGFSSFRLSDANARGYSLRCGRYYSVDEATNSLDLTHSELHGGGGRYVAKFKLAYFEEDSTMWSADAELCSDKLPFYTRNGNPINNYIDIFLSIDQWKKVKAPALSYEYVFMQPATVLFPILKRTYPYVAEWALESKCAYGVALLAPYLEVLSKAGFTFVNRFINCSTKNSYVFLSRLCQHGTNPKRIFKVQSSFYMALKDESDLSVWDAYRKLVKFGRLSAESIGQAVMVGLTEKELDQVHHILGASYANKSVFSWTSLMNYLQRLDTFEAIDCRTALQLLRDYLHMCKDMNLQPKVDSDSLRREHDVTARNYLIMMRQKRDNEKASAMRAVCEEMAKLNYREEMFFVRGIENLEDLYDEANQQRNCVASYAGSIAKGLSYVFVMREVASPDKSLITIEIDPNTYNVRQKYLARNEPIRNKEQTDFINRWITQIKRFRLGE